jgi:hypothetical protein
MPFPVLLIICGAARLLSACSAFLICHLRCFRVPADIGGLAKYLSKVSFAPPTIFTTRWDGPGDITELRRPSDFSFAGLCSLLARPRSISFDASKDALYYFVEDIINLEERKKLASDSNFAEWVALSETFNKLPCVWVYPKTSDAPSPEQAPRHHGASKHEDGDSSRGTPSSPGSQAARIASFKSTIVEMDKMCVAPDCGKMYTDESSSLFEAAHIIPHALHKYRDSMALGILGRACMTKLDLDTPRNGMLLCLEHHTLFDRLRWTTDPASGLVVTQGPSTAAISAAEAANSSVAATEDTAARLLANMQGKPLDFSHRTSPQRPLPEFWAGYYSAIYEDKGAAWQAYLRSKGVKRRGDAASKGGSSVGDGSSTKAGAAGAGGL